MPKLTDTQTMILSAGAQRPDNIALPLPKGLAGAAAKMAVSKMIEHGWLQEVDANLRRGEPLWRETGDGHGTTLVVTEAGLLAIGIEPVVVKTVIAIRQHATKAPEAQQPTPRSGTKQAMLIAMLQAPEGATMEEITAATQWLAHTARGAMSGALGKKLGLIAQSCTEQMALHHRTVIDRFDVSADLTHVRAPTLVIHARLCSIHPVAEGRRVAAGIPAAEFVEVDSSNTFLIGSDPTFAQVIDATLEFLSDDNTRVPA